MAFLKKYIGKPALYAALGVGTITAGKLTYDYAAPFPVMNGVYSSVRDSVTKSLNGTARTYTSPEGGSVEVRRFSDSEANTLGGAVGGLAGIILAGAASAVAGGVIYTVGSKARDKIKSL